MSIKLYAEVSSPSTPSPTYISSQDEFLYRSIQVRKNMKDLSKVSRITLTRHDRVKPSDNSINTVLTLHVCLGYWV